MVLGTILRFRQTTPPQEQPDMTPEDASTSLADIRPAPPYFVARAPHHGAPGERQLLPAASARPHHGRDFTFMLLALVLVGVSAGALG